MEEYVIENFTKSDLFKDERSDTAKRGAGRKTANESCEN